MEKYTKGKMVDVSWRDMLSQDPYFGLSNSFQYSENLNVDDELHGIKLSQKVLEVNDCENCQLLSVGDRVFAVPRSGGIVKYIEQTKHSDNTVTFNVQSTALDLNEALFKSCVGVIFQDYLWIGGSNSIAVGVFAKINVKAISDYTDRLVVYDHPEDTDESIASAGTKDPSTFIQTVTAILNYNNTRLVVGDGQNLRVYYPELDMTGQHQTVNGQDHVVTFGETGWKRVQRFEDGCVIVGLTCTFEYLKVWVQDEGWNTKMYYYQGNNDLRNTFVYNLVDLTGTKVLRVYGINGIDYFVASLDGTDGYVTLNKVVGNTPIQIFKQRGGLTHYDINQKSGYFVGPMSIDAGYLDGNIYMADSYGVFKFLYNPEGYDTGYMKWKLRDSWDDDNLPPVSGLAISQNFCYVSDQEGLKMMRLYDTGVDGYQEKGLLVSREMEGDFGGCVAKMLDEIRLHYELNHIALDAGYDAGDIDIYVSPNNLWEDADPTRNSFGWYHVMHIDGTIDEDSDDYEPNSGSAKTRFEITHPLNNLDIGGKPAFEYDRQTITYCVVITRGTSTAKWTPVVREVNITYHIKGKTNNIYDITNKG